MTIAGVILAGGQSRRMGGTEKSLMELQGATPLEWVMRKLAPQVEHLAINANGDPSRFDFSNLPVLQDTIEGHVGPLAGALAGMRWARTQDDVTHVVTGAADTPFIPDDLVEKLSGALAGDMDVVMACSNCRIHPVFALWPISLADALEHFLVQEDKRKILEFARRYTLHEVVFPIGTHDPFFNINTPEDMRRAESIAEALDNG